MRRAERLSSPACSVARDKLRDAIFLAAAEGIPAEACAHAEQCPDCRAELDGIAGLDTALAGAMRSTRAAIRGPTREEVDAILCASREEPAEATLFRNVRRSANRMLLLTLLVLSFLAVCLAAWALFLGLKAAGG